MDLNALYDTVFVTVGLAAVVGLLSLLLGIRIGSGRAERALESVEASLQNRLTSAESQGKRLASELKQVAEQADVNMKIIARLPEIVGQMNSDLSFDELVPVIIKTVKAMIDTESVELYIYDREAENLGLVAAYGAAKGKHTKVSLDEGVVGHAAAAKMVVTKQQVSLKGHALQGEKVQMAAPIMHQKRLIGVIGIGRVARPGGNEKRFLSIVTELAGVALKNYK